LPRIKASKGTKRAQKGTKRAQKGHKKGTKRARKGHEIILKAIEENPFVTISSLAEQCELSLKAVRGLLNQMKSEGIIHRIGPNNGGHWEIVKRL
jgi:ATP-dependent DNA helicase RecG